MIGKALIGMVLLIFQGCASQPPINLIDSEIKTIVREDLKYYLYFPKDYETSKNSTFGLLLFLHGGGDSGTALDSLKSSGPPKLIAEGKDFPFLILAPQNPFPKKWWNTRAVKQLLDSVVSTNRIATDRIYLTGLSRGGGAAWEMAVQYPDTFAALAVVCGMAPLPYASWINKSMPIWVFHGEKDESIPFSESETMVKKLKRMGYQVRFTSYPDTGHNSWGKAYATDELYEWLNSQRLKHSVK
ncbi:prolyl oligopeptidase family serine peptidase [Maribacter sp. 2304DJ31-5]|uniref:carboxylesterase family protein n=1 Tax=Maribacter sp. 2304DJ31-5 TaxID=3386273 RepID=UPI0039BCEF0E